MEAKAKIMVVDDEKRICENVAKILTKNDYEVYHAFSAEEALEKMALESFSLLISDIVMPGMNGLELLKLVKNQWPLTRVLIFTAYAATNTAAQAIRLGALDYIPKPFTPDELRSSVSQALAGELMEAPQISAELDARVIIDVDSPFDRDEVAKVTGEGYAERLTRSDLPVADVIEVPEFFCTLGNMICDIYKKTGVLCKPGQKKGECPQQKAKKKKAARKAKTRGPEVIAVDQPFNYKEVVSITGPEYVQYMERDGTSVIPYEELKKSITQPPVYEEPVEVEAMDFDAEILIGVDQPFNYEEVVSITGPEFVDHMGRDGASFIPYEELKRNVAPAPVYVEAMQEPAYKNILVIDDEVAVNNNIRKILTKKGYHVDQAVTKQEALEKIDKRSYKLVLLDLKIPEVKGLELLHYIRDKQPDTMVVIITGYASIETAVETARLGAVDYLAKPFTPDEIRGVTEKAIQLAA
ncbi:response regulator [Thermodesulfobacteriota bacterium]